MWGTPDYNTCPGASDLTQLCFGKFWVRDEIVLPEASISPLHCVHCIIIKTYAYLELFQPAFSEWKSLILDGKKEYPSKLYFLFIKNTTCKDIFAVLQCRMILLSGLSFQETLKYPQLCADLYITALPIKMPALPFEALSAALELCVF